MAGLEDALLHLEIESAERHLCTQFLHRPFSRLPKKSRP